VTNQQFADVGLFLYTMTLAVILFSIGHITWGTIAVLLAIFNAKVQK